MTPPQESHIHNDITMPNPTAACDTTSAMASQLTRVQIAERNQKESPLLHLPGELRNQIWAYALGGDIFYIRSSRAKPYMLYAYGPFPNILALLKVCRQTYAEAALLLYSHNTFSFDDIADITALFQKSGPKQMQAVQRLDLDVYYTTMWQELRMLNQDAESGIRSAHDFSFLNHFSGVSKIDIINVDVHIDSDDKWSEKMGRLAEALRRWAPNVVIMARDVNEESESVREF